MSGARRTGDWNRVNNVISHLATEMTAAKNICLQRFALKAEAVAKGHITAQNLGWRPLRGRTIAQKVKKGQSENIYVASGTYFRNITSTVKGNTAYAGVMRGSSSSGSDLGDIARMLEFGSHVKRIPARALWQPTFKECIEWTMKSNSPAQIAVERLKRY